MRLSLQQPLLALSLAFPGTALGAQEPAAHVFRGPASALEAHPFHIGDLEIRVREFKPNRAFGTPQIVLRLENLGSAFLPVSAEELVLVGQDGRQVQEGPPSEKFGIHPLPGRIRIAPRAHVALTLFPDKSVKFPAKLYFGERLLAEITE
jgi:hypothetical protein